MSCIITYKGNQYSEQEFKNYFNINTSEFIKKVATNKNVINSFKNRIDAINFVFQQAPEIENIGTKIQYLQYLSTIFPNSKVKDIVYHGTNKVFDNYTIKGDFGFHFGTKKSAEDRLEQKFREDTKEDAYHVPENLLREDYIFIIKQNIINLKNPLRVPDTSPFSNITKLDVFLEKNIIDKKEYDYIKSLYPVFPKTSKIEGMNEYFDELDNYQNNPQVVKANKEYQKIIESKIRNFGYDGLVYTNNHEDVGKDSYVVFDSDQIYILGDKQDIERFKEFVNKQPMTIDPFNLTEQSLNNLYENSSKSKDFRTFVIDLKKMIAIWENSGKSKEEILEMIKCL